jgi:hypothetical protein
MSNLKLIKVAANREMLPDDSTEQHVAVLLPDHGLMFTATNVAEDVPQKECEAAAKACTVGGYDDWSLPTVEQLQLLVDRTRRSPAINTDYFRDIKDDWYWTTTAVAGSSASAWGVYFNGGYVGSGHRDYDGFALAVRRVGQ